MADSAEVSERWRAVEPVSVQVVRLQDVGHPCALGRGGSPRSDERIHLTWSRGAAESNAAQVVAGISEQSDAFEHGVRVIRAPGGVGDGADVDEASEHEEGGGALLLAASPATHTVNSGCVTWVQQISKPTFS